MDGLNPDIPIDEVDATKMIITRWSRGSITSIRHTWIPRREERGVCGEALREHRSKVMIATKFPVWNIEKPEDMARIFTEQLQRLQTDYVDIYHVHGLGAPRGRR